MKTQDYKLIVLKKKNEDDNVFYLARECDFEQKNMHDCYDKFGQKIGSENAEDYSIENSYCTDLRKKFVEDFKSKKFEIEETEDVEDVDDILNIEEESVKNWAIKWREENENYTSAKVMNYFDGHNWRSVIIECDIDDACNYEEVEMNEIIEAYENVEFEEEKDGKRIGTYNNYEFMQSLYYGDPFEASIIL